MEQLVQRHVRPPAGEQPDEQPGEVARPRQRPLLPAQQVGDREREEAKEPAQAS
jgi:hypothetical protein